MGFFKNYISPNKKGEQSTPPPQQATPSVPTESTDSTQSYPSQSSTEPGMQWTSHVDNTSSNDEDPFSVSSRPASLYPDGDFRNANPGMVRNIKCEVMVNWLHMKQEENIWTTGGAGEGVVLKKAKGEFVCCPAELQIDSSGLYEMVSKLNVRVSDPGHASFK